MLIFDQLRRSDRQLQVLSLAVLLGMMLLLGGLWWVQVISRKKFQDSLKIQSFRTAPISAVRGKIIDRNGIVLADNQPHFNVNLFLEDLPRLFTYEYTNTVRKEYVSLTGTLKIERSESRRLQQEARYRVVSNIVWQVSSIVGTPMILNPKQFAIHYTNKLALPLPILPGLSLQQLALFMEKGSDQPGVDLEVQPIRTYPHTNIACHILGFLRPEIALPDEDEVGFSYPLPTFAGKTGLEGRFDEQLRGKVGVKSILVNNVGYRQREEVWTPAQAGQNLTLTLDYIVQRAADQALRTLSTNYRGAAVVMDVRNGDLLAVSSFPSYDPNLFMDKVSDEEWTQLSDPKLLPQLNRAIYGTYPMGSVFKIIDSLVALENGHDVEAIFHSEGSYQLGRKKIGDTAGAGEFNFRRAFLKSSNPYFIDLGLKVGAEKLIEMGHRFHLGEYTGALTNQEHRGYFPPHGFPRKQDLSRWQEGDTANLAIGQGELAVTPIQVACMTAAVANRGTLFFPRLVARIAPQEGSAENPGEDFSGGRIRDHITISDRTWNILHEAMLADVEDPEGSGRQSFVQGLRVCGKTGTAQLKTSLGVNHIVWFASFAPYESPRYAVVVMAETEHVGSGGGTCAPVAREIFKALQREEQLGRLNLTTNN